MEKQKAALYPTASLAYLGDAVLEVLVREKLVLDGEGDIHGRAKEYVTAVSQSEAVSRIMEKLTADEEAVYKRGRNNSHTAPKSATHAQYSRATGMECVFGYLYLTGDRDRAAELFAYAYPNNKKY